MTLERIACISIGIAFTSSIASGQQASRQEPANSVIEHRSDSGRSPWRAVSTRSGSGGRMIVIETVEEPDVDGRMSPIHETVTETTRSGSTSAHSRRRCRTEARMPFTARSLPTSTAERP